MNKLNLSSLLNLLPVVGPVIAAAPQFKAIYDGIVEGFSSDDQETAQQAYTHAVSDAENAATELADIVRRHA